MSRLVPISIEALPIELLTRIFQFAYEGEHCLAPHSFFPFHRDFPHLWVEPPKQPDILTHVCSTWRRTALTTSSLWSHIDIVINDRRNHNFFSRAKVYAQRAGHHPLEIHICDQGLKRERHRWPASGYQVYHSIYEELHDSGLECLGVGVVPIRSLTLDIHGDSILAAHLPVLEYFLTKCAKGTLVDYVTRARESVFLETAEHPQDAQTNLLGLPQSKIEEQWRSVKVVHVTGLCPRWSSELYHGLVDLRLGSRIPEITELQLVGVLKASPGLRILHLRNQITFEVPEDAEVSRIPLNDLEVLNVEQEPGLQTGFTDGEFVRWLQPGVKPLRFTFFGVLNELITEFMERSNMTRFYYRGRGPLTSVDLLCMAPRLQTLVIDVFDLGVKSIETILYPIDEGDPTLHIDTLYLHGFEKLALGDIQEAVDRYSIQRLFLWFCDLAYPLDAGVEVCSYEDVTTIREKLSKIRNCSIVEYLANNHLIDLDTCE